MNITYRRHAMNFINKYILAIIALVVFSCSSKTETTEAETENTASEIETITITQSQFKSSKMVLGKMSMQKFSKVVITNGMFDVPPENRASVSVYFGGYVKDISLLPGQEIAKGQVLFSMENPDYINVQQEYLEAKGQLAYLKSDFERQKNLYNEQVASKKNYLKAASDYQVTLARYEALKKKLGLMNINPEKVKAENIKSIIVVRAPISGFITSVNAVKGKYLNPSDISVNITNPDHLHLELNVFEKDYLKLKVGQPIEFTLQNNPNKVYEASVYLISKSIDAVSRVANVHGHLSHEDEAHSFAPGMYVEAKILTATDTVLALPQEAIINVEDAYFVLRKKQSNSGSTAFEKVEVKVGDTAKGYTAILNADKLGEKANYLVKGAFYLIQ